MATGPSSAKQPLADAPRLAQALASAFQDDPVIAWIFPRPATPPPCPASLQRYDHCPGTPVVVLRAPHPRPGGVKQIAGPTMHREQC
jgi:hypothetical protein